MKAEWQSGLGQFSNEKLGFHTGLQAQQLDSEPPVQWAPALPVLP